MIDRWPKHLAFALIMVLISACDTANENEPSHIPVINLYFDEGSIDYDDKREAEVHIQHGNIAHRDLARLKFRGGISRAYPKPSFTFNLQADPHLSFLERDNDYILNSSYIDKTMLRHAYSYDLFKKMTGDEISAPKTTYVELFINHDYHGLYLLHPRVDRSYLNIQEDGCIFKDPPLFFSEGPLPVEEEGNPFHQKYPDLDRRDDNNVIQTIRDSLKGTDLCSINWSKYFDQENILNWHLFLLVAHSSDNLLKNFYLFRQTEKDPFRVCIWDCDHSFGRDGDNELNQGTDLLNIDRNWFLSGIIQCQEYQSQLARQYRQLRENGPLKTKSLISTLDSMYLEMRQEIYKNGERWPWNSEHYFDDNTADEEAKLMKAFIRRKMKQLDQYFL